MSLKDHGCLGWGGRAQFDLRVMHIKLGYNENGRESREGKNGV